MKQRFYFCAWIEMGGWFGGTKCLAFHGEFVICEAHEILKRDEGATCPIILSWQEISESQYNSYGYYAEKVRGASKPKLAVVAPLVRKDEKDGI